MAFFDGETTDIISRVRWYVSIRFLFLFAISFSGIASIYIVEGMNSVVRRDTVLAAAAVLSNVVFFAASRLNVASLRYYQILAAVLIALDILLITYLIYTKGGIESRSAILYALPILMSAPLFGRLATYLAAFGSAAAYSLLIILDYNNVLHSIGAINPNLRSEFTYVINTVLFFPAVFLLIALAVDYITKLLIKQQKQAGESLEALKRAQAIAKLGSWEWDIAKDKINWSDELFRLFGIFENERPNKLTYESYLKLLHPDDVKQLDGIIRSSLKNKKSFTVDHRIVLQDGTIRYIHSDGKPFTDENGKVYKLAGTAQDITESMQLENTKREFVTLASHQLRTPATAVKAFLGLLAEGYSGELSAEQRKFLKYASDANDRQLEIIENLLSLAAIESGRISVKKEQVDLRQIVKKCVAHHRLSAAKRKLKLRVSMPNRKTDVYADPNHLSMAIDNLIANAVKYTPPKGSVEISLRTTASHVFVEVKDSGIGIKKDDIPMLFSKFTRLDEAVSSETEGSGLGLYLAKHLILLQKGFIRVSSRPKQGSVFTVKLPLSSKKPSTKPARTS